MAVTTEGSGGALPHGHQIKEAPNCYLFFVKAHLAWATHCRRQQIGLPDLFTERLGTQKKGSPVGLLVACIQIPPDEVNARVSSEN